MIVNPNRTQVRYEFPLPEDADLYNLSEGTIPEDTQFVTATDKAGQCIGTSSADRVRKIILRGIHQVPLNPLLDELEEMVVAVNCEGIIFYVNHAHMKILGGSRRENLGKLHAYHRE